MAKLHLAWRRRTNNDCHRVVCVCVLYRSVSRRRSIRASFFVVAAPLPPLSARFLGGSLNADRTAAHICASALRAQSLHRRGPESHRSDQRRSRVVCFSINFLFIAADQLTARHLTTPLT